MKKLLILFVSAVFSSAAFAQSEGKHHRHRPVHPGHHNHHHYNPPAHHHHNRRWERDLAIVAGSLVIGGLINNAYGNSVQVEPAPVYVEPPRNYYSEPRAYCYWIQVPRTDIYGNLYYSNRQQCQYYR